MAFQTSATTVQNIASMTSELWPTISAVLKSPWQGSGRHATSSSVAFPRAITRPDIAKHEIQGHTRSPLPDFLESVPTSTLRPTYAAAASVVAPTVSGIMGTVPRSAFRLFSPISRNTTLMPSLARQYSTMQRKSPLSQFRPVARVGSIGLALAQRRSIFGGPSQHTLARLEQAANNSPGSATAQAQFYSALLRANMPQIVLDRHKTGKFASNSAVESYVQKAAQQLGLSDYDGQILQTGDNGLTPQQMQTLGQAVGAHLGGGQVGKIKGGSGLKSDPLYVVVDESVWSAIFKWVRFLLGFALAAYVALVIITLFVETSGVFKKVGGATTSEVRPEHQTARFTDVHGCDEAKEELQDVIDFLKNPDRYNKLGGRMPKGVLLIGPPGTGKTLLARAVAGEAGVPFFYMSGSEFDEVYVGVGAKRVRELFSTARSKAPAIVFIDELDAIGGKRQSRDANYHRQTLNQLLNDLDGFDQTTGVIFIAATNHPEILDKALLRPGRFDRHINVDLPDVRGRMAILKHHTKKIRLDPEVDLTKIARGTPGFSGAELENLANTAAIRASKHQSKFVTVDDMEWAKDKITMGSERTSRSVPLKDKLQTAYHEGGHTLVGLFTKGYKEVHKATILPRGVAAGITYFLPHEESHRSKGQYIADLQISMGGRMAEELVYGADNVGDGASGDIQQATSVAYAMVTSFGFSEALGNVDFRSNYEQVSPETKRLIDNEVRRLIDEAKESARQILTEKRKELDLLAQALVQYETLNREEILKVIKGEKLLDRMQSIPDADLKLPDIPTGHVAIPPPARPTGPTDVPA